MTHLHPGRRTAPPRQPAPPVPAVPPPRRRQPSNVRRAQVLDRATELAASAGLAHLTMKRIAATVGFSEAAIYRHFPTKQALLLGLMDRLEARLLDPIREVAAARDRPAIARVQQIVAHHLSLVLERHSLPIQLLAEASAAGDAVLLSRMRDIMRTYIDILTRLLGEAIAAGTLRKEVDPEIVAVWLLGGPAAMAIGHRLRLAPALERRVRGKLVEFVVQQLTCEEGRAR